MSRATARRESVASDGETEAFSILESMLLDISLRSASLSTL
jgi:hypothetical protein